MSSEQAGSQLNASSPTDEDLEVARNFAEAFLNAAENIKQSDQVLEETEEIARDVFSANPQFVRLLGSNKLSQADGERIINDIFVNRASDLTVRFLRVLNRHGRLSLFPAIANELRRAWNKRHNLVPVEVRSAVPLDESQQAALSERVGRMIGATPILDVSTDHSLIGGVIVKVGDYVYDASVKNRLEQLRQRLIEGKTHEIQSRRDQFSYPA